MIDRYSDAYPFFLVRIADLFVLLRSGTLAVNLYCKAQDILSNASIIDSGLALRFGAAVWRCGLALRFGALHPKYASKVDDEANEISRSSQRCDAVFLSLRVTINADVPVSYYQKWKPNKEYPFPTSMPYPPPGSQDLKDRWQELVPEGSIFFHAYMTKLAIETNHVEGIFLLMQGSAQDLVRLGVSEGL